MSTFLFDPLSSNQTVDIKFDIRSVLCITSILSFTKQSSLFVFVPGHCKGKYVLNPLILKGLLSSTYSKSYSETQHMSHLFSLIEFPKSSSFLYNLLLMFKLAILKGFTSVYLCTDDT